jgi:hypothetical protein
LTAAPLATPPAVEGLAAERATGIGPDAAAGTSLASRGAEPRRTPARLTGGCANDRIPVNLLRHRARLRDGGGGCAMKSWIMVLKAADAAARWHVHQRRKGAAKEPYINHL